MGSDLYQITTLAKKDLTASLKVDVVHPDSMYIPADNSFALMILHEAAKGSDPIAKEVAFEDTLDEGWMTKFATGFIRSVKVTDIANRPPKAAETNPDHAYWQNTKKWMSARLDVTVTHPAWLEHLKKGANWSSRAFELVSEYDRHPPITPEGEGTGKGKGKATEDDGAFVAVPSECFADMNLAKPLPAMLLAIPAYAASAYSVKEKITKPTDAKKLSEWIGKAVMFGDEYSSSARTGVLGFVEKFEKGRIGLGIVCLEAGSKSGGVFSNMKWVGLAAPKTGRRGTKLGYQRILECAATVGTVIKKKGKSLTLSVRIPPDGRKLPLKTETDIFHLIAQSIFDDEGIGRFHKSALTTAVIRDLEDRELEGSHQLNDIYPEIAKSYVASFKIKGAASSKNLVPQLDKAPFAETKKLLEVPWAEATVEINVTSEKWIAHIAEKATIRLHEHPMPKPTKPKIKAKVAEVIKVADQRAVLFTQDNVWILERWGKSLKTRWGKRTDKRRQEKTASALPSEEKAIAAFDKAVLAKQKEKYKSAPAREEAVKTIATRLGLQLTDNESGELIVTKAGPPCDKLGDDDMVWFKPKDRVTSVYSEKVRNSRTEPTTVEELAVAIAPIPKSALVYLGCMRPASGISTSQTVNIR